MPDSAPSLTERAKRRVGAVLAEKWTIERLIGVGGTAAVYVGVHRNKKRAAIKVLHPELSVDPYLRARFLREGYVANTVGHPGAVRVDDDDVTEDGSVFLVMELLDGETVNSRWNRKSRRMNQAEVLWIGEQVLDVLDAAHAKGIVHRDIKPENLFITRDGVLKVLDFGIAQLREPNARATTTRSGMSMGTPAYMAPEQARGRWEEVDVRTDLWAVGAVLFALLTGRLVHEADTANEALAKAMSNPSRPIRELCPEVPESVAVVIDRALAYHKRHRFASAAEMRAALRDGVRGLPVHTPALTIPDGDESRDAGLGSTVAALRASRGRSLAPKGSGWWAAVLGATIVLAVLAALALSRPFAPSEGARAPLGGIESNRPVAERKPVVAPVSTPPAPAPTATRPPRRSAATPARRPPGAPGASLPAGPDSPDSAATGDPDADARIAPPGADCDPPYRLDERGIKRFRAECL